MPREDILPVHLRLPQREFRVASTRGVDVAVTDWGTEEHLACGAPTLVFAHATGLHGHCYTPMVAALSTRFRCVGIDQRAQGNSNPPTVGTLSWDGVADDVEVAMGALELFGRADVYGLGHSQGGYAVLEVENRRPGTFKSLFLYEPVVFPPPGGGGPDRVISDNHMATMAAKRRASFDSWEDALANFSVKGPFARSDRDLVSSYVYWGFDEQEDGSVTLKCKPTDESELFRRSITDLFDAAPKIGAQVTVAISERTEPIFRMGGPALVAQLPNAKLIDLPGRTHFGMFEDIPGMASIVAQHLLEAELETGSLTA